VGEPPAQKIRKTPPYPLEMEGRLRSVPELEELVVAKNPQRRVVLLKEVAGEPGISKDCREHGPSIWPAIPPWRC